MIVKSMVLRVMAFVTFCSFSLFIPIHSKKNGSMCPKHSKINGCRVFKKLHIFLSILHRLTQSQNASKINGIKMSSNHLT